LLNADHKGVFSCTVLLDREVEGSDYRVFMSCKTQNVPFTVPPVVFIPAGSRFLTFFIPFDSNGNPPNQAVRITARTSLGRQNHKTEEEDSGPMTIVKQQV